MSKFKKTLLIASLIVATTSFAQVNAESYSFAASPQGSIIYSAASAIAKTSSENKAIKLSVQPFGGSTQYIPLVNIGEMDFAVANVLEVNLANSGHKIFSNIKNEDLRAIGVLFPLRVGYFVPNGSDIESINDLKGKKISSDYSSQEIMKIVTSGLLASGNVGYDDVKKVPSPNLQRAADDFAQGRTDAFFFGIGGAKVTEVDASVNGVRLLPVGENLDAIQEYVPKAYSSDISGDAGIAGINSDTPAMTYDYMLFANKDVPDEVVYELTKTLHENKESLSDSFSVFKEFEPNQMRKDVGIQYHPGALKYYEEINQSVSEN